MKLITKQIEVSRGTKTLKIQVRAYENEKQNMLGFVSYGVYEGSKFIAAFNDFRVVAGKKGVFLSEPSNTYTDKKTGEVKSSPIFIQTLDVKKDLVAILEDHFGK